MLLQPLRYSLKLAVAVALHLQFAARMLLRFPSSEQLVPLASFAQLVPFAAAAAEVASAEGGTLQVSAYALANSWVAYGRNDRI
jgi:hypothetical protein